MNFMTICALLLGIALAGCAYKVPVTAAPALSVYDSYGEQLPGFWVVYIEAEQCQSDVRVSGWAGSAHKYPVDCRAAFIESAEKTIANLVERSQRVDAPLMVSDLARYGATALVVARFDSVDGMFSYAEGLFEATAMVNVEMQASVTIDGPQGRLFGSSASGMGRGQSGAGIAGEGSAAAIGEATQKAMRALLGQIGERIANSQRLREAARPGA